MLYDTIAEYDAEITATRSAISRQLAIGYQTSNASGGSSRSMTDVDLDKLRNYLLQLRRERAIVNGDRPGGIVLGASW